MLRLNAIAVAVTTSAISLLAGCGSNQSPTPLPCTCINPGSSSYLYAAVLNNILAYKVGTDGVPSALASQVGPNDSTGIIADASSKFIYVADSGNGEIDAFTINALNGSLTQIAGSPFSTGPTPIAGAIAIDSQTRFLYLPDSNGVLDTRLIPLAAF